METKEEKASEFQVDLKKKQKRSAIIVIIFSTIMVVALLIVLLLSAQGIKDTLISFIFMGLIGRTFLWGEIERINIASLEKKLRKEIDAEKGYINGIKADYSLFKDSKINDIPKKFRDLAGNLLLAKTGESPEELIARREKAILEMEFRLEMYKKVSERNFWQYFISWKWLFKA